MANPRQNLFPDREPTEGASYLSSFGIYQISLDHEDWHGERLNVKRCEGWL